MVLFVWWFTQFDIHLFLYGKKVRAVKNMTILAVTHLSVIAHTDHCHLLLRSITTLSWQ
jgi:hypothetical protein